MYSLLLERPLALFLCWTVVQFALICLWSWRHTKRGGQAAIVGFGALPILLGISYFVVTPAEEVIAQCQALAAAVDDGDMTAIRAAVAPEFGAAGLTQSEFLSRVEQTLTRIRVDHPRLSRFVVDPSGNTADAQFSATCRIRSEEVVLEGLSTRWRVSFRRDGEHWLITTIESIPVPPLNLRTLDDWLK